jgi:PBSX family phage terminase large subunit
LASDSSMAEERLDIKLHRFQWQAVFAPQRFVAMVAGKRGGKTLAGAVWSRIQFDTFPGDNGIITIPTYKTLQQATLPTFFKYNPDLKKFYKKSDQVIEVPGRGLIFIRSMDSENSIEGIEARWIWADEAGMMSYDAWVNMQGRVSRLEGKIFLTTTPYDMGWLFSDFYQRYRDGDQNYLVVQFRSVDNPYFPEKEFLRLKQTLDSRLFKRQFEGQFEKMEGLVYPDFDFHFHVTENIPKDFDFVIAGVDWGWEAPTSIGVWGIKDDVFYRIDEWVESHKTQEEIEEVALMLKAKYNIKRWYPDKAEPDRIASFNAKHLYCMDVNKDITWGIAKITELIKSDRLRVHPRCRRFLDEIERYHYPVQKEGTAIKEEPVKVDDHCMDEMRYALTSYQPPLRNKERKPISLARPSRVSSIGF